MSDTTEVVSRAAKAINFFPEKFGEAFLACMFAMTNGDMSVWSYNHVKVAYNTGIWTAITFSICVLLLKKITPFKTVLLTGFFTFIADLFNHPTHYGHFGTEALVTGLLSGFLALIFQLFSVRMRSR
jgi:ascorbate-specific PTS system EIIC-type component UlaA